LYVYGSLFFGVITVYSFQTIFSADDQVEHVITYVSNHLFLAFCANIGACFSQEADNIITPSISFSIASSKLLSSQNTASLQEKII
jgi:hypothetical protein